MAAATAQQPASAFTFLKHGVLVPASKRRLFLQLVAVSAVISTVLNLFKSHTLQPLGPAALDLLANFRGRDVQPLATVVEKFLADQGWLLLLGAVYLVAYIAVEFAIQIATFSAAVAAFSSEHHTFLSFLCKVKGGPRGPIVAAALGGLLKVTFHGAIIVYYAAFTHPHSLRTLLRHAILAVFAGLFHLFLEVVCAVAAVASVAEPGLCGTGAMGRAWRLIMSGGDGKAALSVTLTLLLGKLVSQVCILGLVWFPRTAATVMAYYLLVGEEKVFSAVTVTAYYFECTRCNVEDQKAGHGE